MQNLTSCFVISSERWWGWGWGWRSELLGGIQRLGLGLAPPPPPHWRGQAVQATPPHIPIIPADQWEVVMSYSGHAGPSRLPLKGAEPDRVFCYCVFVSVFYWVFVGFYLTDASDRRRGLFYFLERGQGRGFVQSLTGGGRGGAYWLSREEPVFSLQTAVCLRKLLTINALFLICCLTSLCTQTRDITATAYISVTSRLWNNNKIPLTELWTPPENTNI